MLGVLLSGKHACMSSCRAPCFHACPGSSWRCSAVLYITIITPVCLLTPAAGSLVTPDGLHVRKAPLDYLIGLGLAPFYLPPSARK